MENSYEFSLYGRGEDQVNGPSGYEYLYWSVPQTTSVGSDLNDFVYNSAVYVQPNIWYEAVSYDAPPVTTYGGSFLPNFQEYYDVNDYVYYQPNFQVLYPVMPVIDHGTTFFYHPHVYYSNDYVLNTFAYEVLELPCSSEGSWGEGLAYCDGYSDQDGYIKDSWSQGLVYCDGYSDQAGFYGAVDDGPCYGHFPDGIVGPEISSCFISYTEIPEKLNDAPVNSDGEVYERKGKTYSSYGNDDKEGEGDTSVSSRFKSTLKRDSDLKEFDLKEYYFNDIEWLRIPKPEIRYESESEKYRLYQLLGTLNMSSLKKDLKKKYNRKKRKVYKRACRGQRMKKYQLKELNWVPHQLDSILEKEETEPPELTFHESSKIDSKNIENDVVGKEDPPVESQIPDEDPNRVKVGDIYVRYAPDRYRVFCLENSKKRRFPAVRKFFGRIFSYVKKPN